MMDVGGMGSFGWAGMAFGLVFWVAIIAFGAWAIAQVGRDRPRTEDAEDVLRRRYAGGEINDQEFESARRALRRS
ncbi:MAG: SHOCT domain-containing protein [Chloroflexi bacterium]|nr:SHOCT domain-containing protein [Chloroflexota bacterium]